MAFTGHQLASLVSSTLSRETVLYCELISANMSMDNPTLSAMFVAEVLLLSAVMQQVRN
jgi:hypothetical protein